LIQQRPAPRRYVGVDLQRDAIKWCRDNLTPHAPQFRFHHQNVYNLGFNPKASAARLPFPVEDDFATLVLAWSVFTHTLEENVPFYLGEVARILRPEGVALTTWMLFDKSDFPMMQDFQNALYINLVDPTNATIFDKRWLRETARRAGLVLTRIDPPGIRGDACRVFMRLASTGAGEAPFPPEPPARPAPAP
jgi:SAM-dependent methyltransferase